MKKSTLLLLGFIIIKFVLQYLLINPAYDLQRDEYLHLDQGSHLAWGYISVPPVTSWISYIIMLLGGGVFWVKFFPLLFGCLTLILLWRIVEILKGGSFAFLLTGTAFLLSPILRLNILYQPNSLDVFAYTWVYYCLIQFFNNVKNKWLYITSVAAAFGFLSKYNIVFLLVSLAPALLITKQRAVFTTKHLYFAAALGFVLISPNLLWQYQNNFPTLHQLRELQETQLVNVSRVDFLKDQILYFISSLFIIIAALVAFVGYPPYKKYRFIFFSFIFSLALFTFLKAKSYYAIGLYPVLMAFGSVYLESVFAKGWRKFLKPVSIMAVILLAAPFVWLGFPIQSPEQLAGNLSLHQKLGMLRWEDGKDHNLPQDFADMLGWKELAAKVDSAWSHVQDKEYSIVLCDNYGQAGAINYYSKFKNINAVSFNADYINWIKLDKPIRNIVRVYDAGQVEEDMPKLMLLFGVIKQVGSIGNKNAREFGTTILLLQDAKLDINKLIADDIKEKKY